MVSLKTSISRSDTLTETTTVVDTRTGSRMERESTRMLKPESSTEAIGKII
jgi:hypothetical protein